jgi:hypothetical protein
MTGDPKNELVQIRVSLRQKQTLTTAARQRGQSLSALLRDGATALIEMSPRQIADTRANIENVHFPAVRPVGSPQPTGTIEWDWVGLTYA